MYVPDLEKSNDESAFNVGWLQKSYEYTRGKVDEKFLRILKGICEKPVTVHRGFHICEFCDNNERDNFNWSKIGNGIIEVKYKQSRYYAPVMIHHYIELHGYLPPNQFIEAVMAGKTDEDI